MATKLCDEFFENYATLLRLRIYQYHVRNGGEAKFINRLIYCPQHLDAYDAKDFRSAHFAMKELDKAVANNHFAPELNSFWLDETLQPCYYFELWHPDLEINVDVEYLIVGIEINEKGYEAAPTEYPVDILDEVSDDVWRKMIADVNGELTIGTILGAPVPLED